MKSIYLSDSGIKVSPLIYSFWRALDDPNGLSYETIENKVKSCLSLGINTFDHADFYGDFNVEKLFGKAIKRLKISRDKLVISSKYGFNLVHPSRPSTRIKHYDNSPQHIRKCVEQSLKNFNTDYLDILLLSQFDPITATDATASELTKLVISGKVRHIGVANFTVHQHQLLQSRLEIPILTNHIKLNVLETEALQNGTIDFIKQQYSKPLAWAPLAGGRIKDKNDISTLNVRQTLSRLAKKYSTDEEGLAIAWLLKLEALPVLGNTDLNKIKRAASAVDLKIDRQDWYEIYFSSQNT
ncbi:MAG TPA: aldo/keto reductase, partial [Flavobacteriales bacterium]|nr:aldo/keto reductase [Flavobacteriales bacterium]